MTVAACVLKQRPPAEGLLSGGIALAQVSVAQRGSDLFPAERDCLSARAVSRRRREFAAGRVAAHRAMAELGVEPGPVLCGPDRAPIWPQGLVGSITHTDVYAFAAVGRVAEGILAIGLDVEHAVPLEDELLDTVCSESESRWLENQAESGLMAKLIFCAKEAAYKCQYSLTGQLFGFDGLEIRVNEEAGSFEAVLTEDQGPLTQGTVISGRFSIEFGLIMAAAEVRAEPLP